MDSLQTFFQYAMSGVNFLLIITVLVFVHELGHFLAAKATGMHVDAFALCFGGVRKSNLEEGLSKRLFPAKIVAALFGMSLLGSALSAIQNLHVVYIVCLFFSAIVFPIWIGTRIAALYRLSIADLAKTLGIAYLAGVGIVGLATKGAAMTRPADLLLLMFYAAMVGLLLLYYKPLGNRGESDHMGYGSIINAGETKEVRFRPVMSWTSKQGTEFSLLALPLGGFAKMRGMNPQPDASETKIEGGFYSKSPIARLIVLFAGPLFSILFGCLLFFTSMATYGEFVPKDEPRLARLSPDGAAATAGLKEGDMIKEIDGVATKTFYDIVLAVRESQGKAIKVSYLRGGTLSSVIVTPVLEKDPSLVLGPNMEPTGETKKQFKLGASPPVLQRAIPLGAAISRSLQAPIQYAGALGSLLRSPEKASENLAGPVAIAKETHSASQAGSGSLLVLAAILSTSLGFMNLLPIPPLDGGQMVVAIAEMFRRGRRLSLETQATLSAIGMGLVVMLMLWRFGLDAGRLLGGN